ncbi:MAG: peptide deformylase, partial [Alphaproteobacteria bacterium]|nr:peptide deformylase [Alphaproteobacteria bacterium]
MTDDLFNICIIPNPVLRERCAPVDKVDAAARRTMERMLRTMYDAPGIGLAASQVGILQRLMVVDLGRAAQATPLMMANPDLVWHDPAETFTYPEGCLSIPGHYADVTRPKRVRVRYIDENNQAQEIEADDLLSSCLQHEMDHLNGVLFIDHLSPLKRKMILKKVEK